MKITPITGAGQAIGAIGSDAQPRPVQQSQNIRSIRMSTQATPLEPMVPPSENRAQVDGPGAGASPITNPDSNSTSERHEDTKPLSPQLALLAKQRRALQVKERELAEKEQALSGKVPGTIPLDALKDPAQTMRVLREAGLTYQDLIKAVQSDNQGLPDAPSPKDEEYQKRFTELEEKFQKQLEERDQLAKNEALNTMREEARSLADKPEYDLIKRMGKVDDVIRFIDTVHEKTGDLLSVDKAMQLYEEQLEEDYRPLVDSPRFKSQQDPRDFPPQAPQQRYQQAPPTLRNRDTAQVPLSAKQRAIQAFYNNMKR